MENNKYSHQLSFHKGLQSEIWLWIKYLTHSIEHAVQKSHTRDALRMHALSTHIPAAPRLHSRQPPAHTCSNTVTTEHASKPSSFCSLHPISCQKDAQAAIEVQRAWSLEPTAAPENFPWGPGPQRRPSGEEAAEKAPHSHSAFCSYFSSLSSFSGKQTYSGGSDRLCHPVVTITTSKMRHRTIVLAEQ